MHRAVTRSLAGVLAAAWITGCADRQADQGLSWTACDPAVIRPATIAALGDRLRCASLQVPIDHAAPGNGTLDVALSRVAARDPARRRGAIFVNPGGPGGDGLAMGAAFGRLFAEADPSHPIGSRLAQLSDEYDVVGFSPRGVGSSTTLTCSLDAVYQPERLATVDRSPQNRDAILHNQELDALACRANDLTPAIHTDATARDMDLARAALGDARLSYLGYSYGTWLGLWYASLFPEHVGRMVLDSTVDYTNSTLTDVGDGQAVPLQFVLDQLVCPYAALNDDRFGLGTSAEAIRAIFGSLDVALQTVLSPELYGLLFSQDVVDAVVARLGAARGVDAVLRAMPGASAEDLRAAVAARSYAPSPEIDRDMRAAAGTLLDSYLRLVNEVPVPVTLVPEDAVNKAVTCNDGPSSTDPEFWNRQVEALRVTAPAYFHDRLELNCTTQWGGPTTVKPDVAAARSVPNILMVQDQFDPATPLPGALATYQLLGNASLIYNSRSYSHGVFPSDSACIDLPVAEFFLSDDTPGHFVVACEGQGLLPAPGTAAASAAEDVTLGLPPLLRASAAPGATGDMSGAYVDAASAAELRRAIHDVVQRAASRSRAVHVAS